MTTQILSRLYEANFKALMANLDGINDKDALILPPSGGNCINWIVGHILASRDAILNLLEKQPVFEDNQAILYKRGSKVEDVTNLLPFGKLKAVLTESQKILIETFNRLNHIKINEVPEPESQEGKTASLIEKLAFFQFHEAYHVGQTGLLRRIIGKKGAIQ